MIIDFNRYNGGGGSGSGVTPEQVQQQIDSALTPYWDSAITESAITEAVSGLATEQYVQDALSGVSLEGYWNSAETLDAISAATSGKADAVVNTANNGRTVFPKWNNQGVITGEISQVYTHSYFYLNGARKEPIFGRQQDVSGQMRIYAPTTSGNPGEVLISTGNGAPVWSAVTGPDMSDYWNSAETKTYVDNRIDGFVSAVTLTPVIDNPYLRMEGITVGDGQEIAWEALGRPRFYTTNIQQYEMGNDPADPSIEIVDYIKFRFVAETNEMGELTGVYYALPDDGEFVEGVPVQLTRTTSLPSTVYNTPADGGHGVGIDYFIWDNVNLTITWSRQPVVSVHIDGVYDAIDTMDEVVSAALVDLNERVDEISGNTGGGTDLSNYWNSAQTENAISVATQDMVTSTDVRHMVKLSQAAYDQLSVKDPQTFYIIVNNN